MPVRYGDKFTVPTSSDFWTKQSVRKGIGKIEGRIAKASPPKSKIKSQSEKPISRKKRMSFEGYAASLGGLRST